MKEGIPWTILFSNIQFTRTRERESEKLTEKASAASLASLIIQYPLYRRATASDLLYPHLSPFLFRIEVNFEK
jgi:hypothetical protein